MLVIMIPEEFPNFRESITHLYAQTIILRLKYFARGFWLNRSKRFVLGFYIVAIITTLVFVILYINYRNSKIFRLERAVFDLNGIPAIEPLQLHFTLAPYGTIPRVADGVIPIYSFTANDYFGTPFKEFKSTFEICLNYDGAVLDEIKEETLSIYWFDQKNHDIWEKLDTNLNVKTKVASAKSYKLGDFALMGEFKNPPPPLGYYQNEFPLPEWKKFTSIDNSFSLFYPPHWLLGKGEYFSENEVFSTYAYGDQQGANPEGTEFYDGVLVSLYVFPDAGLGADSWIKKFATFHWYSSSVERPITHKTLESYEFYIAEDCEEDSRNCNADYVTRISGKIYQFSFLSLGADAQLFYKIASQIPSTLVANGQSKIN